MILLNLKIWIISQISILCSSWLTQTWNKVLRSGLFLTAKHVKEILYNLLASLYYLHSAKVLHRDLKPANVLVDENCSVLLWDFGLARSIAVKEVEEEKDDEESQKLENQGEEELQETTPNTTVSVQGAENQAQEESKHLAPIFITVLFYHSRCFIRKEILCFILMKSVNFIFI